MTQGNLRVPIETILNTTVKKSSGIELIQFIRIY